MFTQILWVYIKQLYFKIIFCYIPQTIKKFWYFFTESDPVSYWNINVSGVESLNRSGNITIENNTNGITVRTSLEVHNIRASGRASYRGKLDIGFTKIKKTWETDIKANVNHIKLRIGLNVDLVNNKIDIIDFEYEVFTDAHIELDLDGVWNIFNNIANDLAEDAFNSKLKPKLKQTVRDSLEKEFSKFKGFDIFK